MDKHGIPLKDLSKKEFAIRLNRKMQKEAPKPQVSNAEFIKNLSNKGSKKMATKTEESKKMKDALIKQIVAALGSIPNKMVTANEIGLKVDGAFYTIKITQKKTEIEGL